MTNYAYGLSMLNYAPETFGKFDVIVCDEAHGLDGDLENFVKMYLSRRQWERYGPSILFTQLRTVREHPSLERVGEGRDGLRLAEAVVSR